MNQLGLGIHYRKVMQIENDIERSISKIENVTGGFAAPQWLRKNEFMSFAIDNIDFNEATYSGKDSLHGTAICVYQERNEGEHNEQVKFIRTNRKSEGRLPCTLLTCIKPLPKAHVYQFDSYCSSIEKYVENQDMTRCWITSFLKLNSEEEEWDQKEVRLTWSGFNSRLSTKLFPIKNVGLISPLLRTPPTKYETLLTEITRCGKINTYYNGDEAITVIGLDMQLFDMAMRLWATDETIRKRYFFVAGQLHTVFWALQNLGSYIKGKVTASRFNVVFS